MEREDKHWKSIDDLISKTGKSLNILEEEIDIAVQRQYMIMARSLPLVERDYEGARQRARDEMHLLADETTSDNDKKRLLVLLATVEDVPVYRVIEAFAKLDTPLQKWATVALQQSRMLIQSALLDEATIFLSTGLGGQGGSLRYFCVFVANTRMQPYQREVVEKETEMSVERLKGSIEQFDVHGRYITVTILLPVNANIKDTFKAIIDECNTYGGFLNEQIIITNVKKLTVEEIDDFLLKAKAEDF
ncbi:MAG: hypothetical protein LBI96_04935 [Odoribacteraceae bacterium]|jgi:hypothetical protein|nr:hypothetical protein [Odoribacteraceae bacterium]